MRSRPRDFLTTSAALLAVLALPVVDAAILFRPGQIERRVDRILQERYGSEAALRCASFSLFGDSRFERVRIAPLGGGKGSIAVERATFRHEPFPLLLGRYQVREATLEDVDVYFADLPALVAYLGGALPRAPRGATSREPGGEGAPPAETPPPVRIRGLSIHLGDKALPFAPLGHGPLRLAEARLEPVGPLAWRLEGEVEAGPTERIRVVADLDLPRDRMTARLTAQNLDIAARNLFPMPGAGTRLVTGLAPQGPVDADLTVDVAVSSPGEPSVTGTVETFSLSLRPPGFPAPVTHVAASARLDGDRLEIERARGIYEGAVATAEGLVEGLSGPEARARGRLRATGISAERALAPALPPSLRRAVAAAGLEGPCDLFVERRGVAGDDASAGTPVRAEVYLRGASLALGLPVSEAHGRVELAIERHFGADATPTARGRVELVAARWGGERLRDVKSPLSLTPDELCLPELEGFAFDGRFEGSFRVPLDRPGKGTLDVRFGPLRLESALAPLFPPPVAASGDLSGRLATDGDAGTATLSVERARLLRTPALRPLGDALEVLRVDAAAPARGRASIRFDATGIAVEEAHLTGPGYALRAAGRVARDGELDLAVDLDTTSPPLVSRRYRLRGPYTTPRLDPARR